MVAVETASWGTNTRLRHKFLKIDHRIQISQLFLSQISFTSQGKPNISSLNYYLDELQPILRIPPHVWYNIYFIYFNLM